MKLIDDLKRCKGNRKKYRIKPTIKLLADKENYYFSFIPTILWMPYIYRYPSIDGVIDIWWLHFHILIGKWEELSCSSCVRHDECVKTKRLKSYWDNVMADDKKCPDFKSTGW